MLRNYNAYKVLLLRICKYKLPVLRKINNFTSKHVFRVTRFENATLADEHKSLINTII